MDKVLFIDTVHPYLEEALTQLGYQVEHNLVGTKETITTIMPDYVGLVVRSRIPIDKAFLDKAINLKFIARSGAGLENIDVEYAEEKNIRVFNSPEGNKDAVGEHIIGMLLLLFNSLKRGDAEVRKGIWKREENRGMEIAGKTIGIIGYGNMGSAFAKKLSGFDCTVIANDKYRNFQDEYAKQVDLEILFHETDILSIHLPLSEETYHYVDDAFIRQFQKSIFLVNTARGNHVNTSHLVRHLKKGTVAGACLDVLEYENTSFEKIAANSNTDFQYLAQSENVVLSPHVAGWTKESYVKLASFLAEKIRTTFH